MSKRTVRVELPDHKTLICPRFDRGDVQRLLDGLVIDSIHYPNGRTWKRQW